ncbi:unnamed protein product [Paramecium primaurelia]|uniref:non-specific serine/threonine protein kinase n=1 Tax=Paramecium primaurelia TaxID=5886 RepID=A0A8S1KHC9_PARPR|nr:unnamed protein product [Paramecium primaurelia]
MQKSTTLADFTILQKLGEGSFGQVFRVKRVSDQCEYAMKKVRINNLKQKERENALNEIRILASINDAHIIGYKEAFFDELSNQLCVIMEFAGGGDIQKQITACIKKQNQIEEKEIWKALAHMTLGLRVLHKSGILHRDLKSANVFKSIDGKYKIGDLNVSKVSHGALAKTQTGTPYYASPEVWRDQPYSSPSDIWSLGCVIYEMATLKPPFRAQDVQALFKKVSSGVYEKIPKSYSNSLSAMISQLLKVPAHLRPTCDQILCDPNVKPFVEQYCQEQGNNHHAELLQTILLPKNLKQLQAKLPKPTYETNKNEYDSIKQPPKSTRSASVNERKGSPIQTPQIPKKDVSKPLIPPGLRNNQLPINPPIRQSSLNRPSSSVKNLSPAPMRKSVEKQNRDTLKNKSPSTKRIYENENIDRSNIGQRRSYQNIKN